MIGLIQGIVLLALALKSPEWLVGGLVLQGILCAIRAKWEEEWL